MSLHQLPSPRIPKPATIAEAFEAWSALIDFGNVAEHDATANALCAARAELESHALNLQAHTALDVWRLVAMTMDQPFKGRIDYTADAVIVRAHREVNGSTKAAKLDQAACLVDASVG